jgi:CYTH domain-containing protein
MSQHEIEVERAFLATEIPVEIADYEPVRVTDIYLSSATDLLSKLRLRQKGDQYEMTKKVVLDPSDLSTQQEYNIPLTQGEFTSLRSAGGREVVKDRYLVPVKDRIAEIDIFRDLLKGFVIVEFEFGSAEERDEFVPPHFCGVDVTQEDFIAGAFLAGKSYADIAEDLQRFNYVPLSGHTE